MRLLPLLTVARGARVAVGDDIAVGGEAPITAAPLVPEMDVRDRIPPSLIEDPFVGIYMRCQNIQQFTRATAKATDSRARVEYMYKGPSGDDLLQIAKTEVYDNQKEPWYKKPLEVRYDSKADVFLNFSIYEISGGKDWRRLGSFTADMATLRKQKTEVKFNICKKGMSAPIGGDLTPCADGKKDEAWRGTAAGYCWLSGFEKWDRKTSLTIQLFAMDLPNMDPLKRYSPKTVAEYKAKQTPLPVGTDPYFLLYASKSLDKPCTINDAKDLQWTWYRPTGVKNSNCRGPIRLNGFNDGIVKGHSSNAPGGKRFLSWNRFSVSVDELCGSEWDRMVTVLVLDDDGAKTKRDDFVGGVTVPAHAFKNMDSLYRLGNITRAKNAESRGLLMLNSTSLTKDLTAAQYVKSGVQVKVTLAVDFSSSNVMQPVDNREDMLRGGLHRKVSGDENDYEKVLTNVHDLLGKFDTDGQMPLWTFGGIAPGQKSAEGVQTLGEFKGTSPLLKGYRSAVDKCMDGSYRKFKVPPGWGEGDMKGWCFSGPSTYGQVVDKAALAAMNDKELSYHVLVVITDGDEVTPPSMPKSQDLLKALQKASTDAPLSVIFVGLGNGRPDNFGTLRQLENKHCGFDPKPRRDMLNVALLKDLRAANWQAERQRQITKGMYQFNKKYKGKFAKEKRSRKVLSVNEMLARQILEELPEQMLSYFVDLKREIAKSALDFVPSKMLKWAATHKDDVVKGAPLPIAPNIAVSLPAFQHALQGQDLPFESEARISPAAATACSKKQSLSYRQLSVCMVPNVVGQCLQTRRNSAYPDGTLPGHLKSPGASTHATPKSAYRSEASDLRKSFIYPCGGSVGTNGRATCDFPFMHDGVAYTKCTSVGHDQPWCKTTSHGDWGNCECGFNQFNKWVPKKSAIMSHLK